MFNRLIHTEETRSWRRETQLSRWEEMGVSYRLDMENSAVEPVTLSVTAFVVQGPFCPCTEL